MPFLRFHPQNGTFLELSPSDFQTAIQKPKRRPTASPGKGVTFRDSLARSILPPASSPPFLQGVRLHASGSRTPRPGILWHPLARAGGTRFPTRLEFLTSSCILSRVRAVLDGGLDLRFSEVLVLARVGGTRGVENFDHPKPPSLARAGGPYLQVDIFDSQIPAPRPAPCPRLPKQRLKDRDLAPLARDPDDGGRLHSHFGNALPPSQNLDVLTNGNLKNCHRHAWTRL